MCVYIYVCVCVCFAVPLRASLCAFISLTNPPSPIYVQMERKEQLEEQMVRLKQEAKELRLQHAELLQRQE